LSGLDEAGSGAAQATGSTQRAINGEFGKTDMTSKLSAAAQKQ
jgi:hypothetical protein